MKGDDVNVPTQQSVVADTENLPEEQLDDLSGDRNVGVLDDTQQSVKQQKEVNVDSINPEEEHCSEDDSGEDNEEGDNDDEVEVEGGGVDSDSNYEDEEEEDNSDSDEEDQGPIGPIDENEVHSVESTRNLYREEDVGEARTMVEPELPDLVIGMEWATMQKCRDFLKNLAIQRKYAMKQLANKAKRQHYVCKDVNCKWEVYASTLSDGLTMRLRHGHFEHTCQANPEMKNMLANARWVANTIIEDVRNHLDYKPKDIAQDVLRNYHVNIPYWTAWSARVMCLEKIFGNFEESCMLCVKPPTIRRPRLWRRRDVDEDNGRKKNQKQCAKCHMFGHNMKTCKGAPTGGGRGKDTAAGGRGKCAATGGRDVVRGCSTTVRRGKGASSRVFGYGVYQEEVPRQCISFVDTQMPSQSTTVTAGPSTVEGDGPRMRGGGAASQGAPSAPYSDPPAKKSRGMTSYGDSYSLPRRSDRTRKTIIPVTKPPIFINLDNQDL